MATPCLNDVGHFYVYDNSSVRRRVAHNSIASHISIFLLSELGNHTHFQLSQKSDCQYFPSRRCTFRQISST